MKNFEPKYFVKNERKCQVNFKNENLCTELDEEIHIKNTEFVSLYFICTFKHKKKSRRVIATTIHEENLKA